MARVEYVHSATWNVTYPQTIADSVRRRLTGRIEYTLYIQQATLDSFPVV
jgi:hypothetical protein